MATVISREIGAPIALARVAQAAVGRTSRRSPTCCETSSSSRPCAPCAGRTSVIKRSCQRHTHVFDLPVSTMIALVPTPSPLKSTIRAWSGRKGTHSSTPESKSTRHIISKREQPSRRIYQRQGDPFGLHRNGFPTDLRHQNGAEIVDRQLGRDIDVKVMEKCRATGPAPSSMTARWRFPGIDSRPAAIPFYTPQSFKGFAAGLVRRVPWRSQR